MSFTENLNQALDNFADAARASGVNITMSMHIDGFRCPYCNKRISLEDAHKIRRTDNAYNCPFCESKFMRKD